jgi:hypothetical protein
MKVVVPYYKKKQANIEKSRNAPIYERKTQILLNTLHYFSEMLYDTCVFCGLLAHDSYFSHNNFFPGNHFLEQIR